jgi:PAS domain S-box-containing protein
MGTQQTLASTPAPPAQWHDHDRRAHVVHFYSEEASFQEALSRFIGGALGAGDIAIVIATPDHRHGLAQRLRAGGLDTGRLVESGRYISLDARETLSNIMVDGMPDAESFDRVVKGVITRAEKPAVEGTEPRLAVYGEMVALLWKEGKLDAVLALEQLWNRLAESYSFSLRCGYPITSFRRQEDDEPFLRICASHSSVIPSESYTALTSEEERLRSIARLQQKEQVVSELARANENLRESEERFRLFVEGVRDYAIFMLDTSGCVMSWNAGAERIKGYRRDEIVGSHFSVFYPPEGIQSGKPDSALEAAAAEGHFEDEGWRVRKDGSRFYASVVVTAVRDSQGRLRGFSKVTRDITERKRAEEAMRELSGRLLQTRDEERRRLARELHDSTAQTLTALSLNLALIRELVDLAASPRALEAHGESIELARAASQEIRALSYLLHPPMLDEAGLPSALRWYVDGFVRRTKVSVELEVPSEVERLSTDVETALFRIAQECLANIHRHSRSTTASVRLLKHAGQITLEVADQGVGLPPGALRSNGTPATMGVGIRGMHERVRQLGGHLELKPGNPGTRVIAIVPVRKDTGRPNRTGREKQRG